MTLDEVLQALIATLKKEPDLTMVEHWYSINGLLPNVKPTVSVGVDKVTYEEDTRDFDRAMADINIFFAVDETGLDADQRRDDEDRIEYAERVIQDMAQAARLCLCEYRTLGGVLDNSYVGQVDFIYSDDAKNLHVAQISFEAIFYAPRKRQKKSVPVESFYIETEIIREE